MASAITLQTVRLDPTRIALWMRPAGGRGETSATSEHRGAIVDLDAFIAETAPMIAVCGPMFGDAGEIESRILDRAHGIDEAGTKFNEGLTFSVIGGRVVQQFGHESAVGATFAVQCRPTLVANGRAQTFTSHEEPRRVALLLKRDGSFWAAIGAATMEAFAAALAHEGALWAGYLDGGREAVIYVNGTRYGTPTRGVPVWLYTPGGPRAATGPAPMQTRRIARGIAPQGSSGLGFVIALVVGTILWSKGRHG